MGSIDQIHSQNPDLKKKFFNKKELEESKTLKDNENGVCNLFFLSNH